jgi:hypothetical protein
VLGATQVCTVHPTPAIHTVLMPVTAVATVRLQVHSLLNVVRPDRQTLLFSATLPRKIESLVAEALSNPVRISVGLLGAANADVTQRFEILPGKLEGFECGVRNVAQLACVLKLEAAWGQSYPGTVNPPHNGVPHQRYQHCCLCAVFPCACVLSCLMCADDAGKLSWLKARLPGFIDDGDVLCFVGQRARAEEVTQALHDGGFRAGAIHGDMDQVRGLRWSVLAVSACLLSLVQQPTAKLCPPGSRGVGEGGSGDMLSCAVATAATSVLLTLSCCAARPAPPCPVPPRPVPSHMYSSLA